MGKSKGLFVVAGVLIIAILASGCGPIVVPSIVTENTPVSQATDVPERFLPKANVLPITIRSTRVLPIVKVTPVFEFPCPKAVEPFVSFYRAWAQDKRPFEVDVFEKGGPNIFLAYPNFDLDNSEQGRLIFTAVVYPAGRGYIGKWNSQPIFECGFGGECSPKIDLSKLKNGDIVEWVFLRCENKTEKYDCTGAFKILRVSEAYILRNGKLEKAKVF